MISNYEDLYITCELVVTNYKKFSLIQTHENLCVFAVLQSSFFSTAHATICTSFIGSMSIINLHTYNSITSSSYDLHLLLSQYFIFLHKITKTTVGTTMLTFPLIASNYRIT